MSRKDLPSGYRFIDFAQSLIDDLVALDFRAAQRFAEHGFPYLAAEPMDRKHWSQRYLKGDIWVVADDSGPVGYAVGRNLGDLYWLQEVSVDPQHGQKGIGTALVEKTIGQAHWAFHSAIGLSTFRDIPFNAPFYSKLGFVEVPKGNRNAPDNTSAQKEFWNELDDETHPSSRVLMLKRL